MKFAAAVHGAPGAGKTETIKDFSASNGMMCIVFNCSEGLDYESLSRMLKGVLGSGAWICFDEFERVSNGVLSVFGAMARSIHVAKETALAAAADKQRGK